MAQGDRATCRVVEGDTMPEAELPDLQGKKVSLRSLFGKTFTVVLFWTSKSMDSLQELQDLELDFAKLYADKGLRVLGINQGDTPEVARKSLQAAGATFPNLLDPGGEYFAKVATGRLPRTYLLNREGKILWFDIVYSSTTRRQLETAVKVALGELK